MFPISLLFRCHEARRDHEALVVQLAELAPARVSGKSWDLHVPVQYRGFFLCGYPTVLEKTQLVQLVHSSKVFFFLQEPSERERVLLLQCGERVGVLLRPIPLREV